MAGPQIIKTPGGEELIVLSRTEYDALVAAAAEAEEDAADLAIYNARKAGLETGGDAALPAEVSAAMLRGESLLKAIRKWRRMTQLHLAQKTGLGQDYLSDLEAGRRPGTPEPLRAIAVALNIDPAWIIRDA